MKPSVALEETLLFISYLQCADAVESLFTVRADARAASSMSQYQVLLYAHSHIRRPSQSGTNVILYSDEKAEVLSDQVPCPQPCRQAGLRPVLRPQPSTHPGKPVMALTVWPSDQPRNHHLELGSNGNSGSCPTAAGLELHQLCGRVGEVSGELSSVCFGSPPPPGLRTPFPS